MGMRVWGGDDTARVLVLLMGVEARCVRIGGVHVLVVRFVIMVAAVWQLVAAAVVRNVGLVSGWVMGMLKVRVSDVAQGVTQVVGLQTDGGWRRGHDTVVPDGLVYDRCRDGTLSRSAVRLE